MGPKVIQPPEGRNSILNQLRWDGAQWPNKPTTSTPSKGTSSVGGQPPRKPTQGSLVTRERGIRDEQGEEQLPPRPPPRENCGDEGNGNGGDDGDDDRDNDDDNDEDEDDEYTETVTESESEDPNAPGGGGVPREPQGR